MPRARALHAFPGPALAVDALSLINAASHQMAGAAVYVAIVVAR